jgi:hypothetical protein
MIGASPYLECPGEQSQSGDRIFRMGLSGFSSFHPYECQDSFLIHALLTSSHVHSCTLVYYTIPHNTRSLYGSKNLVCYIKGRPLKILKTRCWRERFASAEDRRCNKLCSEKRSRSWFKKYYGSDGRGTYDAHAVKNAWKLQAGKPTGKQFKNNSSRTASPPKMGPTDCPETSITNYQPTLRNFPEERESYPDQLWGASWVPFLRAKRPGRDHSRG